MKYCLCILKSKSVDKYYLGIAQNPERKLEYHNTIDKEFTSRYRPWMIVFTKEFETKELAAESEKKIKSRKLKMMIEQIISGEYNI